MGSLVYFSIRLPVLLLSESAGFLILLFPTYLFFGLFVFFIYKLSEKTIAYWSVLGISATINLVVWFVFRNAYEFPFIHPVIIILLIFNIVSLFLFVLKTEEYQEQKRNLKRLDNS